MISPILLTSCVVLLVLGMLAYFSRNADFIIWGGVILLLVAPVTGPGGNQVIGVIGPAEALAGLANEGVVTIAAMFIVAAGLRETGALRLLVTRLLGHPRDERSAQHRLLWPTALMSGFFNNTPLIAILIPIVDEWARRYRLAVSRLLMPLSFAAIMGGACTMIGTSTNLIINGWLLDSAVHPGLGMFEMTRVMLPIAVAGIAFVIFVGPRLLPDRRPVFDQLGDSREFVVEMQVAENSNLDGQTIEQAGLRGLPGLYLIEIERDGDALPAVSANVRLAAGDHLVFAGIVDSVVDLQRFDGLEPATDQVYKLQDTRNNRRLIEAVVSDSCPLVGRTIRDGQFRTVYNAAVIAVARNGERVRGKIGDITLQIGDVLLLEARPSFVDQQRNRRDFFLVSQVGDSYVADTRRAPRALGVLAALVVAVTAGWTSMLSAALLGACAMVVLGCCNASTARRAIDWEILLVMAGALALGKAMQLSTLADVLGATMIGICGAEPIALLAAIFVMSAILAGVATAKAGAVLMLPIVLSASEQLGLAMMPLIMVVMLASSMSVISPISYPTNLMIYGPGGYRFGDYLRLGGPLTVLIGALGVIIIPHVFPF